MLVNLNIYGAKVRDVSIPAKYGDEKSFMRIWKIVLSFPLLLLRRFIRRIYFKYILYDFSVIGVFYVVGSVLLLWGAFGVYAWAKSILTASLHDRDGDDRGIAVHHRFSYFCRPSLWK
jgi:hypothetical protein